MENLPPQSTPFRLDTEAPNFRAESTKGSINFHRYTGTSWVILFCYPADFGAVATTELIILARLQQEFSSRNVKLLALSIGSVETHLQWQSDVEEISGAALQFPIIADEDRTISHLFQIIDDDDLTGDVGRNALRTRSAFIISPDNKFRLIFNYPAAVGMNIAELLRSVECLQIARETDGIRTPANWSNGGDVVIRPDVSDEKARELVSDFIAVKPYLRFANFPRGDWAIEHLVFHEGHLTNITLKANNGLLEVISTGDKTALPSN